MIFKDKQVVGNKTFAWAKVKVLKVSKYNVRPEITPEEKEEIKESLAKSIKELGLQQLPVCTSQGEVFIGGRRMLAFKELGEEWMLVEIREAEPFEQMIASYTENFHRKEPDWMNEGKLFKEMCETGQVSERELAKKLGINDSSIQTKILAYEKLNDASGVGTITYEQARILSSLEIPDDKRSSLVERISDGEIKTPQLISIIQRTKAAKELLEGIPEKVRKTLEENIEEDLYTEKLDIGKLDHDIVKAQGGNVSLTEVKFEESYFTTQEEAQDFAAKCGGRFVKKDTRTYWILKVDPYLYDELKGDVNE